jgi:2-oxoglutarate ferredoxin oxidoreductase subunit beta
MKHAAAGQVVTGLLFAEKDPEDLHAHIHTVDTALNALGDADLCPGSAALAAINASLR